MSVFVLLSCSSCSETQFAAISIAFLAISLIKSISAPVTNNTTLDHRHRLEHKSPCYVTPGLAKFFLKTFIFNFLRSNKTKFFLKNTFACVLGLEHFCPWPREGLFSKGLSLALASDFFGSLALAKSLVSSTPPLIKKMIFLYRPVGQAGTRLFLKREF